MIIRLIANSVTMSPIGEDIYYYKWWNMAMVMDKGLEIRSKSIPPAWWLLVAGRVGGGEREFSHHTRPLYIGDPFTKVVICLT